MKINDIYNLIQDDTGIDLKTVYTNSETSFLKKCFYTLCYIYAEEYVTQSELIKYTGASNHTAVVNALKDFEDVIQWNKEYSKKYNYLDNLVSQQAEPREIYSGRLDIDLKRQLNNCNRRLRKFAEVRNENTRIKRLADSYKKTIKNLRDKGDKTKLRQEKEALRKEIYRLRRKNKEKTQRIKDLIEVQKLTRTM